MKTTEHMLTNEQTAHLNAFFDHPEEVLFFDIETTGFSPRAASIYLIGCSFYTKNGWCVRQYFADTPAQEGEIVRAFTSFAASFSNVVHFNGQTFDVPFLQAKCKKHAVKAFVPEKQCDIYKSLSPYKNILHLQGCRQKQLEEFIGIHREDPFNGGQLIELYRAYGETRKERLLKVLLLHNLEDLTGMLMICSLMSIPRLFEQGGFLLERTELMTSPDSEQQKRLECQIRIRTETELPVPIACHGFSEATKQCFLSGRGRTVLIRLPVMEGELKFFYPDYKNYSYLPDEDQAIHKSVAVYVDKSRRMPATAETCYTKRTGRFLPCFAPLPESVPVFRASHREKQAWIEADEAFLADAELQKRYVETFLQKLRK